MNLHRLLLEGFWPWWMGALALGAVTVLHLLVVGRLLGVSGVYLQLVKAVRREGVSESDAALLSDEDALMAALEAATLAEMAERGDTWEGSAQAEAQPEATSTAALAPAPWTSHAVFLLALAAGATLSALLSGRLELTLEAAPAFSALWGEGPGGLAALAAGGVLVGFGTCLAGGCTSGHGLSGCSRLQPGSLLATASFFGTGIAVSLALARWIG